MFRKFPEYIKIVFLVIVSKEWKLGKRMQETFIFYLNPLILFARFNNRMYHFNNNFKILWN